MPRYVIESLGARHVPVDDVCANGCAVIVQNDLTEKVSWLHSYVTLDRSRTFCICDGPSPEAIRRAAHSNHLPVARITEVKLLDPCLCH